MQARDDRLAAKLLNRRLEDTDRHVAEHYDQLDLATVTTGQQADCVDGGLDETELPSCTLERACLLRGENN
jgi:hypothetical protein